MHDAIGTKKGANTKEIEIGFGYADQQPTRSEMFIQRNITVGNTVAEQTKWISKSDLTHIFIPI